MILVTGFNAASRAAAIRRWTEGRPAAERWAVLTGGPGLQATVPDAFGSGVASFDVPGGCACCVAPPVLSATLGRLARAGPWDRTVLDLAPAGDPAAMIDALRAHPGAPGIEAVIAVVDATRDAPWTDPSSAAADLALAQRDTADAVVLHHGAQVSSASLARLGVCLSESPFGARPVLSDVSGLPGWPEIQAAVEVWDRHFLGGPTAGRSATRPLPGGGVITRVDAPEGVRIAWRWPASVRFDRGRLLHWWAALSAHPGLIRAHAAFRTERDWCGRSWPSVDPQGFSTHWRRDNRASCTLQAGSIDDVADGLLMEALASGRPEPA